MKEEQRIELIKNTVMAFANNEKGILDKFTKEVFEAFHMVECMQSVTDKAIGKAIKKISKNGNTATPWKDFSTYHLLGIMKMEWDELQKELDELIPDFCTRDDEPEEIMFSAIESTKDELLDVINTAIFSYLVIGFHEKHGVVKK